MAVCCLVIRLVFSPNRCLLRTTGATNNLSAKIYAIRHERASRPSIWLMNDNHPDTVCLLPGRLDVPIIREIMNPVPPVAVCCDYYCRFSRAHRVQTKAPVWCCPLTFARDIIIPKNVCREKGYFVLFFCCFFPPLVPNNVPNTHTVNTQNRAWSDAQKTTPQNKTSSKHKCKG